MRHVKSISTHLNLHLYVTKQYLGKLLQNYETKVPSCNQVILFPQSGYPRSNLLVNTSRPPSHVANEKSIDEIADTGHVRGTFLYVTNPIMSDLGDQ